MLLLSLVETGDRMGLITEDEAAMPVDTGTQIHTRWDEISDSVER